MEAMAIRLTAIRLLVIAGKLPAAEIARPSNAPIVFAFHPPDTLQHQNQAEE